MPLVLVIYHGENLDHYLQISGFRLVCHEVKNGSFMVRRVKNNANCKFINLIIANSYRQLNKSAYQV